MNSRFGPVIDPLVSGRTPDLGAGSTVESKKRSLASLSPESRRLVTHCFDLAIGESPSGESMP